MLLLETNQQFINFICYRLQRNAFSIYLPYFTNDLSKELLVLSKFTVAIYVYESDFLRRKHEECQELTYILSFQSNGCQIQTRMRFIINKKCFLYINRCLKSIVTGQVDSQAFQVSSSMMGLLLCKYEPFSDTQVTIKACGPLVYFLMGLLICKYEPF